MSSAILRIPIKIFFFSFLINDPRALVSIFFYIIFQSQTVMYDKFTKFYNNYLKSNNNNFLLIDIVKTFTENACMINSY